jgi:hypothetical protein
MYQVYFYVIVYKCSIYIHSNFNQQLIQSTTNQSLGQTAQAVLYQARTNIYILTMLIIILNV